MPQAFDTPTKKLNELGKKISEINNILFFVVIVLLVGFVTILAGYLSFVADSNRGRDADYQILVNEIKQQSYKIDQLQQPQNATSTKR